MFETEDMLPRPPPKPSAPPLPSGGSVKPEVPEVSIIFGKPATNAAPISTTQQQPPSYAAWKKQVLPRVNCPPVLKDQATGNLVAARSTVFPLRTVTISASAPQVINNENLNPKPQAEKTFRHSLENESGPTSSLSNYLQNSEHRRSVDSLSQRSSAFSTERALTICASTQTDPSAADNTKLNFDHLIKAVNDLQEEQRQTRRLLETLIVQQNQMLQRQMLISNVFCCDMATQCDILKDDPKDNLLPQNYCQLENGTILQALPDAKIYSPVIKENSPQVVPSAQSTQYRSNTPFKNKTQSPLAKLVAPSNPYTPSLPKACTEKSMVMNELAIKYLPSDKLNELMQDINMTTETTPLREIDNFCKAPTDISTASFHYLRKYCLLPQQQKLHSNKGSPSQIEYNQEPTFNPQRQPLQHSPNVLNNEVQSPHLDLEHIKRQPKFL